MNDDRMSDDSKDIPDKDDDDSEMDMSEEGQDGMALGTNTDMTMTAFDEYDSKSMDLKNFQVTDRAIDPEQQAKEEYMRKLMSFRKDELILPEESDDCLDECEETHEKKKVKDIAGVEEAYEFVERIEDKMSKISNVIRGMDKRMSYNLRLIGSVVARDEQEEQEEVQRPALMDEQSKQDENQEKGELIKVEGETELDPEDDIKKLLKNISVHQKKTSIIPKIKMMTDFTINKLGMNTDEDKQNIDAIKSKLRSIDQAAFKQKVVQKGLGNFVAD